MPVAGEADYPEEIRPSTAISTYAATGFTPTSSPLEGHRFDPPPDDREGFTEFQTPILDGASPEGARDYFVRSRVHPGKFTRFPQAPQMFKRC